MTAFPNSDELSLLTVAPIRGCPLKDEPREKTPCPSKSAIAILIAYPANSLAGLLNTLPRRQGGGRYVRMAHVHRRQPDMQ